MLFIRRADEADAAACSNILSSSIRELCGADHNGNKEIIAKWIANKTPENVARLIANPRIAFFIVVRDGAAAGIGAISEDGEVLLNYVAPVHRFSGVSRAMLSHMEAALRALGVDKATLSSTETAHRFYRDAGWLDEGEPDVMFGVKGHPMVKEL